MTSKESAERKQIKYRKEKQRSRYTNIRRVLFPPSIHLLNLHPILRIRIHVRIGLVNLDQRLVVGLDNDSVSDGIARDASGLVLSNRAVEDHSREREEDFLLDDSSEGTGSVLCEREKEKKDQRESSGETKGSTVRRYSPEVRIQRKQGSPSQPNREST